MAIKSISFEEDLLESLTDPEEAAAYLAAAIRDSKESFLAALRDVAMAHKMAKVAEEASVERASLYRMLSANGNPNLENMISILEVMGLALDVVPKKRREQGYGENTASGYDETNQEISNNADSLGRIQGQDINLICFNAVIDQIAQTRSYSDKPANALNGSQLYWKQPAENSRNLYEN